MRALAIVDRGRGPELVGTRITVFDIIPYLRAGHSATFIGTLLLLSTREVEFLIRYIEEHNEEVMAMNQKIEERIARGNPPEILAKLKQSHAKMLALRRELKRKRAEEEQSARDRGGRQHPGAGSDSGSTTRK